MSIRPDTGAAQRWWWNSAISPQELQVQTHSQSGLHTPRGLQRHRHNIHQSATMAQRDTYPPGRALCSAAASMSSSNTLGFSHVWLVLALSCCLQLLRSIRPGLVPSWRPGVSLVCSLAPCCQCLSLVHWLLLKQFYCLWHLPYYAVVDSELNQWRLPDGDSGAKPDRSPNAVDTYPVEIQGHSQYPIFFLLFGASADISLDYLGENKQKVLFWRSYIMKNTFSLLPRYINWSFLSLPILRMRIVLHGLCNPPTGKTALLQAVHVRLGTKERTQMQIGHTLPRPGACSM